MTTTTQRVLLSDEVGVVTTRGVVLRQTYLLLPLHWWDEEWVGEVTGVQDLLEGPLVEVNRLGCEFQVRPGLLFLARTRFTRPIWVATSIRDRPMENR